MGMWVRVCRGVGAGVTVVSRANRALSRDESVSKIMRIRHTLLPSGFIPPNTVLE